MGKISRRKFLGAVSIYGIGFFVPLKDIESEDFYYNKLTIQQYADYLKEVIEIDICSALCIDYETFKKDSFLAT